MLGLVALQANAADPTLSLVATPNPVVAGSTVAVDVLISGITDLATWQFSLSFNPSVLRANSITEGPFLSSGGTTFFSPGSIDNSTGSVNFIFDTLLGAVPGVSGSGVLARLNFAALAVGSSPLAFADVLFLDSNGAAIPVALQGLTVMSTPVPEPAAWMLFGAGLAGLAASRLTRRR